jgi:cytochrome c oxidase subunit 2
MWSWHFTQPGEGGAMVATVGTLYVPAGRPVDVIVTTEDVIHSFWVPRLGGKLDTIPGRITILRLQADEPGEYRGQCAEFCGVGHAHMQFVVNALSEEDFAAWLEEAQTDE